MGRCLGAGGVQNEHAVSERVRGDLAVCDAGVADLQWICVAALQGRDVHRPSGAGRVDNN